MLRVPSLPTIAGGRRFATRERAPKGVTQRAHAPRGWDRANCGGVAKRDARTPEACEGKRIRLLERHFESLQPTAA